MNRIIVFAAVYLSLVPVTRATGHGPPPYAEIQQRLASGWNTWNTRSVTSHVLLPEGLAINLAFKQHYWLDEKYLREPLIGRTGEGVEHVRPGLHAYDGSFTDLELKWEEAHVRIESATENGDLMILLTPLSEPESEVKLIVESGMLWNRSGALRREQTRLRADLPTRSISIHSTAEHVDDPYVQTLSPYLCLVLDGPIGISTGKPQSVEAIRQVIEKARARLEESAAEKYGQLSIPSLAIQSAIAWNTIYEPQLDRVVSTVGRLWNEERGGYCLFGWDNFFMAYMTGLESRDLAFANVLEHLRGKTEEGFIANDNQGNGRKSWDRSQPPVGGIMVKEIYKLYPERWFLEAAFDDLLGWNRWWIRKRMNEGLLSWGSHEAQNPFNETYLRSMTAAGYESGMDDSPMYEDIIFDRNKNTMELQDVGLNSLYVADCLALAEMAHRLGRRDEETELLQRASQFQTKMDELWDEKTGFYLNRRTDTGEKSLRLSPTLFYPLLARVPSADRAQRMVDEHFFNPEEFWGEWIIPTIARNDPAYPRQRYWKGAVWPPTNFLTYLSLRQAGFTDAHRALSEKSLDLLIKEWKRMGYVSENYSAITGTGDDPRLSSDRYHSWGALMGIMAFVEEGILPAPEQPLRN